MNRLNEIQLLVGKIGVFFANCDGEYDKLEDKFISEFILAMIKDGIEIEDSLKELIDIKSEKYTIDDLLLNLSIGQYDTYTPSQLVQYINTVANNGKRLVFSLTI